MPIAKNDVWRFFRETNLSLNGLRWKIKNSPGSRLAIYNDKAERSRHPGCIKQIVKINAAATYMVLNQHAISILADSSN